VIVGPAQPPIRHREHFTVDDRHFYSSRPEDRFAHVSRPPPKLNLVILGPPSRSIPQSFCTPGRRLVPRQHSRRTPLISGVTRFCFPPRVTRPVVTHFPVHAPIKRNHLISSPAPRGGPPVLPPACGGRRAPPTWSTGPRLNPSSATAKIPAFRVVLPRPTACSNRTSRIEKRGFPRAASDSCPPPPAPPIGPLRPVA